MGCNTFSALMMICAMDPEIPQINNIANVMETEFSVPKLMTGLVWGTIVDHHYWWDY